MAMVDAHLTTAWTGMLLGMLSGAAVGLFFKSEVWLGGYASWPRRMVRLGHISFFGIAFINLAFALTLRAGWPAPHVAFSILLIAANALMPAVCFASAARKPLAVLFPVAVICALVPVAALLAGRFL
jgi:hypothetical protein